MGIVMLASLLLSGTMMAMPTPGKPTLTVEGTEFVLHAHRETLRSADLVGAQLEINGRFVRIDAVRREAGENSMAVTLHTFSVRTNGGEWVPLCESDPQGRREGFPFPGHWDSQHRYIADTTRFALTCTSGAHAKCIRFGYAPWLLDKAGQTLEKTFEACVRMVRADYCGDGIAATRDGTRIDIYDRHGIQRPADEDHFRFEAGWGPEGAVCVNAPRLPDLLTLDALIARCPRLEGRTGAACTEASARASGALLFNESL